jgi:hypothetical protein
MKRLVWFVMGAICGLALWNCWLFLKDMLRSEWFIKWYLPEIFLVVIFVFALIYLGFGSIYCLIKTFSKSK